MRTLDRPSTLIPCLLVTLCLSAAGCTFRGCGGPAPDTARVPANVHRAAAPSFRPAKRRPRDEAVAFPTVGRPLEFPGEEPPLHPPDTFGFNAVAAPQSGAAPLEVKFFLTVSNPPPGLAVSWSFGDDSPPRTSPSASHVYRDPGHYTAVLILTGSNLQETREFSITVTEANFAVEIEAYPDIGRAPLTSHFVAVLPYGIESEALCDWDFGDGTSGTGKTITHTYQQPGTYTAQLLVSRQSTGQQGTADVQIQVDPPTPDDDAEG